MPRCALHRYIIQGTAASVAAIRLPCELFLLNYIGESAMSMTSIGMEKTITDVTITDMVSDDLHVYTEIT
jgi:hypothetical protein